MNADFFDPLAFFCQLNHDKLIAGDNPFGPAGIGYTCQGFLWSKLDRLEYSFEKPKGQIHVGPEAEASSPDEMISVERIVLKRYPGRTRTGFFLYVLNLGFPYENT